MPPLFSGLTERTAGVLLHPTALPSDQGVGTLGAGARDFVDFLAESGVTWWQVCPLGPTGYGDSPYACFSAFAGNPYLIDLTALRDAGLLASADLAPLRRLSREQVEYGYIWEQFHPVAGLAWENARANPGALKAFGDFEAFKRREGPLWLDDYALFRALKNRNGGKPWYDWPAAEKSAARARAALPDAALAGHAEREKFLQFIFFSQWDALRAHAKSKGVKILGDAPIYVAMDSADVWASPELFELDRDLRPVVVAGVPPDYFSATGQLWGNPIYDWEKHRATGFSWWIARLRANLALYDGLRLDHFRAFHDYWRIPAGAKDAIGGVWAPGPGILFFKTVRRELGDAFIVAEDLGELSPGVHTLREACGLPGMAILQFAFGSDGRNAYLPHNHKHDSVVYPGTHDNDTVMGWYESAGSAERDRFRKYFGTDGREPHWTMVCSALASQARLAVLPMQDILGLGGDARFNTPGRAEGNWAWRLTDAALADARRWTAANLRDLAALTDRSPARA